MFGLWAGIPQVKTQFLLIIVGFIPQLPSNMNFISVLSSVSIIHVYE